MIAPTLAAYSLVQLQAALQILKDEKEGIVEPPPRSRLRKLGLRTQNYQAPISTGLGDIDDEDEDEDFDPREEMREHMKKLTRRRAELRAAREAEEDAEVETEEEADDELSPSPSLLVLRKRPRSPNAGKLTFKVKEPGTKWVLRGYKGPADLGVPLKPRFEKHSSGFSHAILDAMGRGDQERCECGVVFGADHDIDKCLFNKKGKNKKRALEKARAASTYRKWHTISRPPLSSLATHSTTQEAYGGVSSDDEFLPDALLEDLLGLQKTKLRAKPAKKTKRTTMFTQDTARQPSDIFSYHLGSSASASGFISSDTPSMALAGQNDEEAITGAEAYYSIIPNIASVQVRTRRRLYPTRPMPVG